ncbi:hypothetical protein ABT144_14040 [Streptomyces sp. NPDC002039]|uniref:hypothetical protein n=1 Tax=Streptomyces sp. NPDC002039 TaxID=3154660 RepID=UPI00332DD107
MTATAADQVVPSHDAHTGNSSTTPAAAVIRLPMGFHLPALASHQDHLGRATDGASAPPLDDVVADSIAAH